MGSRGAHAVNRRILISVLPLVLFYGLTVGAGLVLALLQSLGPAGFAADGVSAYGELLERPEIGRSILYTLYIAGASAILSVILGALLAWTLRWASAPVRTAGIVFHLPIILPHIVVGFVVMVLLAPTGPVSALVARLGFGSAVSDAFAWMLYSPAGIGMILAYVYKEFPFVTLMALGVLRLVPERMVVTARMLGAGPVRRFFAVGVPTMRPILSQVFIILFLYALGGFEIPWLLGSSRPQMIPITIYSLYFQGSLEDRPVAMAALSVLALFSIVFVALYAHAADRISHRERAV